MYPANQLERSFSITKTKSEMLKPFIHNAFRAYSR